MKKISIICLSALLGLASCQDKEWDNYYESGNGQTLMEQIDADPSLSEFAKVVRSQGQDKLLNSSQFMTVFAPDNDAMQRGQLATDTLNKFLYNHICRYTYTQGDIAESKTSPLRIKMLNGKYQNLESAGGGILFGNYGTVSDEKGASNGVLNKINQVIPFYKNIYEEINERNQTDSISSFLQSKDEFTFLPNKSTVLGVNDMGQTVYDSVFNFRNQWMESYGDINLEDSVYTMLVPTDNAWKKQYDKLHSYFVTYGEGAITGNGIKVRGSFAVDDTKADSLTDVHTKHVLTHDLVFRDFVEDGKPSADSLVSTNGHVFHQPADLFVGATSRDVSNGKLYVTDSLRHSPLESWHNEIRVEAESSSDYTTQYAGSTSSVSVLNFPQFAGKVSDNGFLVVNPTQLSFQRSTVRFRLPQTLAAKYNIYLVTVPASAQDTSLISHPEELRSTRVRFYVSYVHADGSLSEDKVISTPVDFEGTQTPKAINADKPEFVTNATDVDKMLIARNFKFPFANFNDPSSKDNTITAYLRVESDVTTASALSTYEKTMRIDCVILEPVNE